MNEYLAAAMYGRICALHLFLIKKEEIILTPPTNQEFIQLLTSSDLQNSLFKIRTNSIDDQRLSNRLKLIENDIGDTYENLFLAFSLTKFTSSSVFKKEVSIEIQNIQSCILLSKIRELKKMTTKEFASILNVNHRNISAWEKHKRNFNPKILTPFNEDISHILSII